MLNEWKMNISVCFWKRSTKKIITVHYEDYLRWVDEVGCLECYLNREVPDYFALRR